LAGGRIFHSSVTHQNLLYGLRAPRTSNDARFRRTIENYSCLFLMSYRFAT